MVDLTFIGDIYLRLRHIYLPKQKSTLFINKIK